VHQYVSSSNKLEFYEYFTELWLLVPSSSSVVTLAFLHNYII
jgi:hypothetical protein